MIPKEDLRTYQARWVEVEAVIAKERHNASFELRWRQLNAAHAMAIGLGLHVNDVSEAGVHARWAKLREKAASNTNIDRERIRVWVDQFSEALEQTEFWRRFHRYYHLRCVVFHSSLNLPR